MIKQLKKFFYYFLLLLFIITLQVVTIISLIHFNYKLAFINFTKKKTNNILFTESINRVKEKLNIVENTINNIIKPFINSVN